MRLVLLWWKRFFSFGRVAAMLSLVGLAALAFMTGEAAMYFRLPPSTFFRKSFAGAQSWWEATGNTDLESRNSDLSEASLPIDKAEATCDGFTLLTTSLSAEADLIDMRGRVLHRWRMPTVRFWPQAADVPDPRPGEPIHWERCRLFPNGDLMALCCSNNGSPYGYGLVKLDKNSNPLWGFSANVHHDFDVGEDGRIYVLTQKVETESKSDLDSSASAHYEDFLVILSPEGKELEKISILESLHDSSYSLILPSFTPPHPTVPQKFTGPDSTAPLDLLHTNSVQVLSQSQGKSFSLFKPGQVLLSLRSPNAVAVLDVEKRSIVWAAKGVWQAQHDARFLDNGRLLLFDNLGSLSGARAIEYDPNTQAVAWWWGGEKDKSFTCEIRGRVQRLDNGNTLVVDSAGCTVFEVTHQKEVVWQWHCPAVWNLNLTEAHRIAPGKLPFLKGGFQARPKW